MTGQVGDAMATPIVGYLVDRYGTKQRWHIFGKFNLCSFCLIKLFQVSFNFKNLSVSHFNLQVLS